MKKLFICIIIFFMMHNYVFSQTEADVAEDDKAGLVSFDFKDADVRNVLRIFSHKTGINIVASPDVQGSVTVKLNNVPWEKALTIILEMNDFAYVREGNVIKVLTRDRIAQEPLKTEVIALDYAQAASVVPTVESMLSERGSIRTDTRANLLIISDVPANFEPIKKVIKRLDLPTPQVLIETKIIETTLDLNKKFGVRWDFLEDYTLSILGNGPNSSLQRTYQTAKGNSDNMTRSIGDTESFSESFNAWYTPLNEAVSTNLTPAVLDEWKDPEYRLYGVDDDGDGTADRTGYMPAGSNPRYRQDSSGNPQIYVKRNELQTYKHPDFIHGGATYGVGNTDNFSQTKGESRSNASAFGAAYSASRIQVVMNALLTDDGTDILSSPSIVTMDNSPATIKVASDFPMPSFAYNEDTGNYEVTGFTPTPIGITLKVTPKVAPNGYVTMDLSPEISRIDREIPMARLGVSIPQIGKENVKTKIMVKDGDTVVLGGLMKQFDVYTNQKVPIFHNIPVLGWLFKSKEKQVQKRNLLLFVTPTILKKENVSTVTQNRSDEYTKQRDGFDETTDIYPEVETY